MSQLISVLERIAAALEALQPHAKAPASTPGEPVAVPTESVRQDLVGAFSGQWVTTTQISDVLGLSGMSARQIGSLAAAAGFQRKRSASGMLFAIGDVNAEASRPGPRVKLPDDIEHFLDLARTAGHKRTPLQILGMAYGSKGHYSPALVDLLRERMKDEPFYDPRR